MPRVASKLKGKSKTMIPPGILERRATRLAQNERTPLYQFALTNDELAAVADISRLSRDDDGKLIGYQRREVKKHVADITEYLDSETPLFPHPLILAFSSKVIFTSSRGLRVNDGVSTAGTISIPVPRNGGAKPGWIVDGQQRALALARASRRNFPIPVCAFITDDVELQRDQFLRINNTRPLPRGLVTELLPEVSCPLPMNLAVRKVPAAVCDLLNREDTSPFRGLIRRPSTSDDDKGKAVVADTVLIKMIEESLTQTSGCLFPCRNIATGECDNQGIWSVLLTFWCAVRDTFPNAWAQPPTKSRLMHGVGIRAMGKLMDRIMGSIDPRSPEAAELVKRELEAVAPLCCWTSGTWEGLGGMEWNELQNLPKHLSMLSNFLIRAYIERRNS